MKCDCGGRIKKGVDYRIFEISDFKAPKHPDFRPPYVHLMPLAELISTVYDKGVTTKTVQNIWQNLVDNFADEINVLINEDISNIKKIDSKVSEAIEAFRNNTIDITPGGGGKYGEINFKSSIKEEKSPEVLTLDNF